MSKPLTVTEFARMGGNARAKKHSKKSLSKWGSKAGAALKKKYGDDYFVKMAIAREKKKKEKRPAEVIKKTIRQIFGIE